ncbi:MAG: MFS transporter [Rhodobacteraceae bacterium]|nr:MFS transporter [Paracoccaceae bacterium]
MIGGNIPSYSRPDRARNNNKVCNPRTLPRLTQIAKKLEPVRSFYCRILYLLWRISLPTLLKPPANEGYDGPPHRSTLGLGAAILTASLGVSIAATALPTLAATFDATAAQAQWVVLAYLLAATAAGLGAGRLADLYGQRRIMALGAALFAVTGLLAAAAPTLSTLILARGAQGIGAAALMTLPMAMAREVASEGRIGRVMGLLGTMSAVGTALGPALGGAAIAALGWRSIFLLTALLGVLSFILISRLPADRAAARQDVGGASWAGLLRTTGLRAALAMNGLVSGLMMATLVVGPFYLSRALGLGVAMVGATLSIGPAVSALSGRPAGWLVDRWGARTALLASLCQVSAGAAALCALPPLFGYGGYIVGLMLLTPGYQLFLAANATAVMETTPSEQRGAAAGLLTLSRNLGFIVGASALGGLFAMTAGMVDGAEGAAFGAQITFGVATVLMITALGIGLANRTGSAEGRI